MKRITAFLLILLPAVVLAGSSGDAVFRRATDSYESGLAAIQARYRKKEAQLRKEYREAAIEAQLRATKAGNLDEAVRLREVAELLAKQETEPMRELREALPRTMWRWPDRRMPASRAWFALNPDGTVTAGWHNLKGLWTVSEDGVALAIIAATTRTPEKLRFASDLSYCLKGEGERQGRCDRVEPEGE